MQWFSWIFLSQYFRSDSGWGWGAWTASGDTDSKSQSQSNDDDLWGGLNNSGKKQGESAASFYNMKLTEKLEMVFIDQ